MTYLNSEQVHVFPFGSTRQIDPNARVFNEQNISQLVRNMTDNPDYVIDYNEGNGTIQFIIHGYYFEAELNDDVKVNGSPLYAYIDTAELDTYEYLRGGDIEVLVEEDNPSDPDNPLIKYENKFTGITFTTSTEEITSGKYLQLLDEDGKVPASSRIRFSAESLDAQAHIDRIYCGTSTEVID